MYPHHSSHITHARSRAHLTSNLPTVYSQHKYSCLLSVFNLNLKMAIVKRPKHVADLYAVNYIYIYIYNIKQSCVRLVHTLHSTCPYAFRSSSPKSGKQSWKLKKLLLSLFYIYMYIYEGCFFFNLRWAIKKDKLT